ncbi:MAG: prolyl oligopeptidase family serine peptidase, partial [Gemmatimonadales bacterium]
LYSQVQKVQYPKAGESNSAARIGVVPSAGGETLWFDIEGDPRNHYLARMDWAASPDEVYIERLNRLQNTLELILADAGTGEVRTILTETDSTWVEVVDAITWLDDGESFLWVSERDGWNHAWLVSRDGETVELLTPGDWDIASIEGIDPDEDFLYYRASPDNPAQRYLYRVPLDGSGDAVRLTPDSLSGSSSYNIAPDFEYAFHNFSTFTEPPVTDLIELPEHEVIRTVVDNDSLIAAVEKLQRGPVEFFTVETADGVSLNGWVMKPVNFDPGNKYPVLFYVYGGPGSQTVLDSWGGSRYLWHRLLTQEGYAVASVDNRGTGMRGRDWRKIIYGRLGVIETKDQAGAARAIAQWPWVDSTRIGIWGWSYGGFMSLNTLFQAPDVYSTAISVAPVTHWKYYDNIYTERYNALPQSNAAGYDAGSPLSYADSLRGDLLVIHGSGDDNVHFQNTEALLNALIKAGKQFQFMEYPNRTHGISGGNTQEHLYNLMNRFLDEHLMHPRQTAMMP